MTKHTCLVLGFHPSSRGFGYALLEDEHTPADWGSVEAVDDKNSACLKRLEGLLDKYAPTVLAMEAFDDEKSLRSERIRELCRAVVALAAKRKITVRLYARAPIGQALGLPVRATREAIAGAVADRLLVLKPRLPKRRRAWDSERVSMALFCAAACALCHYLLPS